MREQHVTYVFLLLAAAVMLLILTILHPKIMLSSAFLIAVAVKATPCIQRYLTCKLCNGRGRLLGYDNHVKKDFNGETCYCCHGSGWRRPWAKNWYKIACDARKGHQKIERLENAVAQEMLHARRQFSYSNDTTDDALIDIHIQQQSALSRGRVLLGEQQDAYVEIEHKAFRLLHHQFLLQQLRRQSSRIQRLFRKVDDTTDLIAHDRNVDMDYRSDMNDLLYQVKYDFDGLIPESFEAEISMIAERNQVRIASV